MLDLLDIAIKHWSLALDGTPRIGPTGLVCLARWRGRPVVLKAPIGGEVLGADVLRAWDGHRAARVFDRMGSLHLLERLDPGTPLTDDAAGIGDLAALVMIAETAADLFAATARLPEAPEVLAWGASLLDGHEPGLWAEAREVYRALASSQGPIALLHGDLHHGNLLWDRCRGWIAIDPKGVTAEAAFELGSALRNPTDAIDTITRPEVVTARLDVLAGRFGFDRHRMAGWAFAQAMLAAAWSIEDGQDPSPGLSVARAYRPHAGI